MATNFYFSNYTNSMEQTLIDDLVIESIKIFGHDVFYVGRKITAGDDLLNEDDLPLFDEAYMVEMYIKSIDGFEGDGDFLSNIGLEIRDSITFTVAIRTFDLEVASQMENLIRPNEGDLIYLPLNGKLFEISHVEHEAIFYQMGSLQTYDLKCELFEYTGQRFQTGNEEIDTIYDAYDLTSANSIAEIEQFDPWADNNTIQTEADEIVDWSETNPFSESGW